MLQRPALLSIRGSSSLTLQRTQVDSLPRMLHVLQPEGHLHVAPQGSWRPAQGTLHDVSVSQTLRVHRS